MHTPLPPLKTPLPHSSLPAMKADAKGCVFLWALMNCISRSNIFLTVALTLKSEPRLHTQYTWGGIWGMQAGNQSLDSTLRFSLWLVRVKDGTISVATCTMTKSAAWEKGWS